MSHREKGVCLLHWFLLDRSGSQKVVLFSTNAFYTFFASKYEFQPKKKRRKGHERRRRAGAGA